MGCIWKYDIQIADMTMESKVRVTANKICLIAGNLNLLTQFWPTVFIFDNDCF